MKLFNKSVYAYFVEARHSLQKEIAGTVDNLGNFFTSDFSCNKNVKGNKIFMI